MRIQCQGMHDATLHGCSVCCELGSGGGLGALASIENTQCLVSVRTTQVAVCEIHMWIASRPWHGICEKNGKVWRGRLQRLKKHPMPCKGTCTGCA